MSSHSKIASSIKDDFDAVYEKLQATFRSGKTKQIAWRKWQLKQLWWMIEDNEDAILAALTEDLGRHEMESRATDLIGMKTDILDHIEHIDEWAATEPVSGAGLLFGTLGRARIRKEPLGVCLVIGAWNFPFLLTLQPVIAAIAAGCCVVIKPSELATASETTVARLVSSYLDPTALRLVTGGPKETTEILQYRFDHIFFTGSSTVARYITAAAAKHLTPVTLELGGQCPAIVTAAADIDLAAKRVAFVKFMNAGQICLSVNHVFVHPAVHDRFVQSLEHWTREFAASGHMCRIVNSRNYDRLAALLEKTEGKIVRAGESSREEKKLASAIVTGVQMSDAVLREEIFGPICPVIKANTAEAIQAINNLPRPLALYIFSSNSKETEEIQNQTISGGVTINDATMHVAVPNAPLGGVGESGMGFYHGKYGFLTFTHLRTVVEPPTWLESLFSSRYPPYDSKNKGNLAVKNRLKFRRGETMADQRAGSYRSLRRLSWKGVMIAGVIGCILLWVDEIRAVKLSVISRTLAMSRGVNYR